MANTINVDGSSGILLTPDGSTQLDFQSNNTTLLSLNSTNASFTGNVGIGTSSPATTLDITTSGGGKFQVTDWGASAQIGVDTASKALRINGTDSVRFHTGTAGSQTERMRIDSNGHVGIGTSSLQHYGAGITNVTVAGSAIPIIHLNSTGAASNAKLWRWIARDSATMQFQTLEDNYGGERNIWNIVRSGADISYQAWHTGASIERMRIDSSGNIGIGTSSPSEKLNVVGNILASGVLKSTSTSMANVVSNATAITVNTSTPTPIASCTITTTGKSVLIVATGDGNPNQTGGWHRLRIHRGGTAIGKQIINENAGGNSQNAPWALCTIDSPGAGTHTYDVRAWHGSGSWTYGEEGNHQAPTIFAVEVL